MYKRQGVLDQDAVDDVQRELARVYSLLLQCRDDHREVHRLRRIAYAHQVLQLVEGEVEGLFEICLLYTSPSPRDRTRSRMPSSA